MLKRGIDIGLILIAVMFILGCSKQEAGKTAPGTPDQTAPATSTESKTTTLNIDSPETPEGVTNQFFKAFFGGDDTVAFSLLTVKAQETTKEHFAAQASDTIKWKIQGVEHKDTTARVTVKIDDLNEEGNIVTEKLVFNLSQADGSWRVSGFSANGFAVDYEAAPASESVGAVEPVQVGQKTDPDATVK